MLRLGYLAALTAGCAAGDVTSGASDDTGLAGDDTTSAVDTGTSPATTSIFLLRTLGFQEADGDTSPGFDLDGTDDDVCDVDDFEGVDGAEGVDNGFTQLMPLIIATGGRALASLVQAAVDSGELLVMIEALGYDQAAPGDCVPVTILRGQGAPTLGGHGKILAGQTFDRNTEFPSSSVDCGTVDAAGNLSFEGFELRLPLAVFDESIDLTLKEGRARVVPNGDGTFDAVIAGGVETAEIAANVQGFDAIPEELISTVSTFVETYADLAPNDDGVCEQISVVMGGEAVPAFFFDDEAP